MRLPFAFPVLRLSAARGGSSQLAPSWNTNRILKAPGGYVSLSRCHQVFFYVLCSCARIALCLVVHLSGSH